MSCALSLVSLLEARREVSKSHARRFEGTSSTVVNSRDIERGWAVGNLGVGAESTHLGSAGRREMTSVALSSPSSPRLGPIGKATS